MKDDAQFRAVIISDTHVPFQNEEVLNKVYNVIKDVKPTHIIHLGDFLDCYSISRFLKDPNRIFNLQDELNEAQKIIQRINKISPKSKKYLLEGNHEERLFRTLCSLDGPARELIKIDSVRSALSWPSLLDLKNLKWEFVPALKQPLLNIIPNMILKHGNLVRKFSGYSAKAEFEQYHMSGISGHTHRLGIYYHTNLSGNYSWIENGCTCDLQPDYIRNPNWQNGITVISWNNKDRVPVIDQIKL
jgi:hypothetical protein